MVLFSVLVIFASAIPLFLLSQLNYLLFHGLAEMFCIMVIAGVVVAAFLPWSRYQSGYATFLAIAFAFVSFTLILHTLAYKGMGVFLLGGSNLPTQLWLVSRYLLAGAFVLAPLFMKRPVNKWVVTGVFAVVTWLLLSSIFAWHVFPQAFDEGVGLTTFKIVSEYVVVALFVLAILEITKWRNRFKTSAYRFLIAALVSLISAELAFTVYTDVYGLSNVLGHVLQITAFAFIFHAFVNVGISDPMSEAHEALEDSEARFRMVVESAPEAIFIQTGGNFAYVNDSALEVFGARAPEELLGKPVAERFHPSFQDQVRRRIRTLNEDRRPLPPADQLAQRLDGTSAYLAVSAVPIRYGGVDGALVFARDVSERKANERELKEHRDHLEELVETRTEDLAAANAQLAEANRAKSRFLANMSHELRTPLNSIIGFSSVLGQGLAGPLNLEQQTQVDMIETSGKYLLSLIDDVLDLEKIDAGRVETRYTVCDPRVTVDEVVSIMTPLAREKGLTLAVESGVDIGEIETDVGKVKQVLLNLVGNAVKFTKTGSIVIDIRREEDGSVAFSVKDTGPGLERKALARVFDAFSQFEQSGEAKPKGTGLGLAISREYAHLIGARLTAESEVGIGSVFKLTLPELPPYA